LFSLSSNIYYRLKIRIFENLEWSSNLIFKIALGRILSDLKILSSYSEREKWLYKISRSYLKRSNTILQVRLLWICSRSPFIIAFYYLLSPFIIYLLLTKKESSCSMQQ